MPKRERTTSLGLLRRAIAREFHFLRMALYGLSSDEAYGRALVLYNLIGYDATTAQCKAEKLARKAGNA